MYVWMGRSRLGRWGAIPQQIGQPFQGDQTIAVEQQQADEAPFLPPPEGNRLGPGAGHHPSQEKNCTSIRPSPDASRSSSRRLVFIDAAAERS
jgi:hypothetical protein